MIDKEYKVNMQDAPIENRMIRYRSAILLAVFISIFVLLSIFLLTIASTMGSERHTDNKSISIENKAIRGKIISADNYVVSFSQKHYRAEVNRRSIDPKKKSLFVTLFSIYSGMSEKEILKKFEDSRKRRVVLCKNIDERMASDLKSLGYKLSKLDVFRPLNPQKPHLVFGLDILPNSETRYFPHKDLLTPVVGYVRTNMNNAYKTPKGIKGLEKHYEDYLKPEVNGLITGKSDILGTPLRDGKSREIKRVDGMDLHLNIELDFQRSVEKVVDAMKKQIAAQEILVAVMDSKTGKVLSLATSERFNPKKIKKKDMSALNPSFSEYPYEPGSVMKPLTLAIALENNKVRLKQPIALGGKFKVNNSFTIKDDDYFKELTPKGIIMYSSNIGISKIAWMLTPQELYKGWKKFGLSKKSGVDLSRELSGHIKLPDQLKHKLHSATMAYGYGMHANFMQMIKAYSAFNNNGIAVKPKIVNYLSDEKGKLYDVDNGVTSLQACSAQTAGIIHDILLATVNRGTGTAAQYDGLLVGGKTGTAHITKNRKYIDAYHSSFYGFANDQEGHKYTIGVFVIKPKKVYFSSHTAAPLFHKVVDKMVKHNYLVVDKSLATEHLKKRADMRKKKHDAYVRKIEAYNKAHGIE